MHLVLQDGMYWGAKRSTDETTDPISRNMYKGDNVIRRQLKNGVLGADDGILQRSIQEPERNSDGGGGKGGTHTNLHRMHGRVGF